MADKVRPTTWRRLAGVGAVLCLVAAFALQLDGWPAFLRVGYHEQVREKIAADEIPEALNLLNRSTLLDESALALLETMPHSSALSSDRARDARLRTAIAESLIEEVGSGRSLGDEQRELLEQATVNAELLVKLEPGAAQSHAILGLVYLQRGNDTEVPIEFHRAARHLRTALQLDPEVPRAAAALRLALARVRAFQSAVAVEVDRAA